MTETDLEREVRAIIRERIDRGLLANPDWVTEAVVSNHKGISGDDKDWYCICAYAYIRAVVRKCVQRYKVAPTLEAVDQQLVLEGFRHVQKAYLIERRGKQVVVPINRLNEVEIRSKMQELRGMGQGCFEHADELSRYLDERRAIA